MGTMDAEHQPQNAASPMQDDFEPTSHTYPPDKFFRDNLGISFTLTFTLLAVAATMIDYFLIGVPETSIPWNYPLYVGFLYVVSVLVVLRKFHSIFDESKLELIDILNRTRGDNIVFERESDVSAKEIEHEIDDVMDKAFSPVTILTGGFIGGAFAMIMMWILGAFEYFPYVMSYAYGAGHRFFYGPILGSVYLIYKISSEYIVDIDVLDPDGVGGYGDIGNSIINLIILGVFLVTLDFIILSSVMLVDSPAIFTTAVFGLYGLMVAFLLIITVFGVFMIRKRLLAIRERKTQKMREEFKEIEARYWTKLENNESPDPEADHIETMDTMFNRLHSMELWPINLASLSRLALSVGSSGAIALYKAGFISF